MIVSALLAVAAVPAVAPLPAAAAQDTVTVSGEVTCADCRIVLDTVVTIGGLDGPGLETVHAMSMVSVDRRNRIYVGIHSPPSTSVFDDSGRFIRSFGRGGEGPGEYFSISHIRPGPRYIHVFDRHGGRTMLDYGFNVVRVDRFPGQVHGTVVLEGDAVVFAAMVGTRAQAGYRFHVLDTLGAFTSFGVGPPESFWGTVQDGNLLFTAMNRNEILRWNLDPEPTLVEVLQRRVAEFDRHRHLGPRDYPGVGISGIRHDSDGLWILWNAPDPEAPEWDPNGGVRPELSSQFKDGWIDLVDPATGLTIARYRGDASLKGFAHGSRYVVVYEETEAGVPYIHLLEPRLMRGVGAAR